jgi:hypothetical protein
MLDKSYISILSTLSNISLTDPPTTQLGHHSQIQISGPILDIALHENYNPTAMTVKLVWACSNDKYTPHILVKHVKKTLEEGAAIFCVEMFGNSMVQKVCQMKGGYVFLETIICLKGSFTHAVCGSQILIIY